ncbi:MAG: dTDP-4-amino-4,6-dideoxygalactose transaminase [Acidobacteriia bacterium]|nr:dTDP-4-amino-4,6-dideoxygalactose transaminase [Terriglobia bacterium]
MSPRIVFNRPTIVGREQQYIAEALAAGHISGDGPFTRRCSDLLERELGVSKALLTTSCTHALELAALLLDLQPDDEVILPSFTFVSTANAFVLRGARPVFVDIRPDTLNLDESRLPEAITARTRAIVPVHYAGVACEMDTILPLAARHGLAVVEDNAHGLFGAYKGRALGTFGCLAALSFHETKNLSCGEGGALLINDPRLIDRADVIRAKGTNRTKFLQGIVDKYTWCDVGSSYPPSDLLAAFLFGQLEQRASVQAARQRVFERYASGLAGWAAASGVQLPTIPASCQQSYHMFYLVTSTPDQRDRLIAHLRDHDVMAIFHYIPLHSSPMGRRWGYEEGNLPVTERVSRCLVRLPFYTTLSEEDQDRVIAAVRSAPI